MCADLLDTKGGPTKHDKTVSSVSLDQSAAKHLRTVGIGELDLGLVQEWIGGLLKTNGDDIFRMKGVFAMAHSDRRFVFHAVHMLLDGDFAEPWGAGIR